MKSLEISMKTVFGRCQGHPILKILLNKLFFIPLQILIYLRLGFFLCNDFRDEKERTPLAEPFQEIMKKKSFRIVYIVNWVP
ncbi:hypothetical protein BA718_00160 [Streptococcus gallolyticus subsp. gallolyticus]|nr:hypothetical protein A3651_00155 [Streptococcus gallolyticus subsp. gallolyticus]OCW49642.1 hypothetical protein BA718_00160 [Streptococcus gallolyticus subsp. gallolyticus]